MMQILWELGYTDQAQQRSAEALALAQQSEIPPVWCMRILWCCTRSTAGTQRRHTPARTR